MTTTGKFTVETTNDDDFEVGATYAITASVSKTLSVFGVTKVSDPVTPAASDTPAPVDEVETPGDADSTSETVEQTIPATA